MEGAGKFITFEGGEGSGKSTQAALLLASFEKAGIPAIKTREPGGTESAEKIREILVKGNIENLEPISELLLNFAARFEHVEKLIKPALAKGTYVLCDRFADSSIAYQGFGHGLGIDYINLIKNLTLGNFAPNLTFLLDINAETGLDRAMARNDKENRFERMGDKFHRNLLKGFKVIAENEPERFVIIDALENIETIHKKITLEINNRFGLDLTC